MRAPLLLFAGLTAAAVGCGSLIGIDKDYVEGPADAAFETSFGDGSSDGSMSADSALDAPGNDTGSDASCAGHICNGVCSQGSSCMDCSARFLCKATRACVSDCSACISA